MAKMNSLFILIIFGCLITYSYSRPPQAEYSNDSDNVEEAEEEGGNEGTADSYSADDEDAELNDRDPAGQEEETPRSQHIIDLSDNKYLQQSAPKENSNPNPLVDVKINNRALRDDNPNESANVVEQSRSYERNPQSNSFSEATDEQQEKQQIPNRDVNKPAINQNLDNSKVMKRTTDEYANEENEETIFEKNREQGNALRKNSYSANEITDADQMRYYSQFREPIQAEKREIMDDKTQRAPRYSLRGRRDVTKIEQLGNSDILSKPESKDQDDKTDSEDEEAAIKRHIKNLTSEELDQLLNSLTEDKRDILKKIIEETSNENGQINKREITKKAGAVEENNFNENCQADLSKVQGGGPSLDLNTESPSPASAETTETNKVGEIAADASQKSLESNLTAENKLDVPNNSDDALMKKIENVNTFDSNVDAKDQQNVAGNAQSMSKTDNKREVNLEELDIVDESLEGNKLSEQDYSNEQGDFNSQDEDMSNFLEDENQANDAKISKREADLSESVKSLEESFPNSNAYDDAAPYTGPLVRVKRKSYDQVMNKRSAALLPDDKIAYVPYKSENDDEDNDEGNEFDEEGFYDRSSNSANSNKVLENIAETSKNNIQRKISRRGNSKNLNGNIEGNTSLGSDTDSVLSGVEGVDDNLMYSSMRGRRTPEDDTKDVVQAKSEHSNPLMEDEGKEFYHANVAFGSPQRNYDGDLSRYKRVRRVKQLRNDQELNSSEI